MLEEDPRYAVTEPQSTDEVMVEGATVVVPPSQSQGFPYRVA